MPNELHIADGSIARKGLHSNYKYSTDLWLITRFIRHKCAYMPRNMYCWLNTCQPPEYWVFTKKNEATGRHVDACPYCGARLKDGRGDVTVYKDRRRHHFFPPTP